MINGEIKAFALHLSFRVYPSGHASYDSNPISVLLDSLSLCHATLQATAYSEFYTNMNRTGARLG